MLDCFPPIAEDADPKAAGAVAWIDLENPSASEVEFVQNSTGYRVPDREALSEIQSSSRNYTEKDAVYLSTPLISHAVTHDGALSPLGLILSPKVLITIRYTDFKAFDSVKKDVQHAPNLTAEEAFVRLMESFIDKGADLLEHLNDELERLSHSAFHTETDNTGKLSTATKRLRDALKGVGRMGDRLSQIRAVLLGLGRVASYVVETRCDNMSPQLRQRLNAVRGDVSSLNDFEGHLADKVQFLLDATLGFINIEQNDIVKVLTIASIVGVPPVFFAGVWGMNFKAMPELGWTFGYPFAWVIMILSALVPLAWFKWKGWM